MKTIFILSCFLFVIQAKEITPYFSLHTKGVINDFSIEDEYLYVATDMGSIDVFDLKNKTIIEQIVLDPMVSTKGPSVPASISSVDVLNSKILIVSRGLENYRDVWIYENYELKKIIDASSKQLIKEARFIDENRLVLASIDSDLSVYDIEEQSRTYVEHISESRLSDMVLSEDKKRVFTADESGEVKVFDVNNAKQYPDIPPKNLDNIFQIAHHNGVTITAGQDRRIAVYQEGESSYYLQSDFLVYCVGLSPSGEIGAYSDGEENELQLFDTYTKQKKDRLVGHKKIVRKIHFLNEKQLISSDQGHDIFFWKL